MSVKDTTSKPVDSSSGSEGESERNDSVEALQSVAPSASSVPRQIPAQPAPRAPRKSWFSFRNMIYLLLLYNFMKSKSKTASKKGANTANMTLPVGSLSNSFRYGDMLDLYVYVDEKPVNSFDSRRLVWNATNVTVYGEKTHALHHATIKPSNRVLKQNGTLYAHIYATLHGVSPSPKSSTYRPLHVAHHTKLLTRFMPEVKPKNVKHLLSATTTDSSSHPNLPNSNHHSKLDETSESLAGKWIAYWASNLSVSLISDQATYTAQHLGMPVGKYLTVNSKDSNASSYTPALVVNDFWLLRSSFIPIQESLDLYMDFSSISMMKWMMYSQLDESFKVQEQMLGISASDFDDVKTMLMETQPWLLVLTAIVTVCHSLFDFLAFRNDISFWKGRKNSEGLSLRSILVNVFFQTVILLYLYDNETSFMVLASTAVGLAIEVWKIFHVASLTVEKTTAGTHLQQQSRSWYNYRLRLRERTSTATSEKSREYDDLAFKYLSYLLYPLAVGYALYSLKYEQHKGWYSWIISSLVGFIYTFGFVMMTPQLFINYKMKSVAHMPWKTFTYKAINTFIDDLFAFIIKMPWLHRLACLRDDVIFFIYLYQKWIYPVDKMRANEFGQVGAADEVPVIHSQEQDGTADTQQSDGSVIASEANK